MNIPKEKLVETGKILKKEFDGIDEIIDRLLGLLASWNNDATRPLVVPIFGMTGTGKTSLVNRTMELLELSGRTMKFTCGSSDENDMSSKFHNTILERLGISSYSSPMSIAEVKSDSQTEKINPTQ